MNNERDGLINTICIVLCVLLAILLVCMIITDKRSEKAQSETIEEFSAKSETYEDEQQELKRKLTDLRNSVNYTAETAKIMTGFVVSETSDISYIKEKAAAYGFTPVVVIDCTKETDFIKQITEELDRSWEIMLYAPTFSAEINEKVLSVISYLHSVSREHCGIFLLREGYNTSANIELLLNEGFIGYTVYNDLPKSGQANDDSVYFDYSFLTSSGTVISNRLPSLYNDKASMIVAFDMASINSGVLTDNYVVSLLDNIQSHVENGDCSFAAAAAVVSELSKINMTEAERQAEYEKEIRELQERIDELDDIIHDIYTELDAEQ
ncbi:MAG: hypothetical protein LUC92_05455 [Clostridiales bacterium]|nr:hypothetical protein [Clostridiales bacterium]